MDPDQRAFRSPVVDYLGVRIAQADTAIAAALTERERSGKGREIIASRLAGGLSAIGALTLTSSGIAPHLAPARSFGLPEGLTAQQFQDIVHEASRNPAKQLWLSQRFSPLASPFRSGSPVGKGPVRAPRTIARP